MPVWRTTSVDSDIAPAGNVLLSKVLDLTGEAAANQSLTVPGTSTRAVQFHSAAGVPNNADWQDGSAVPKVKIVTGFANVQVAVNIVREDAAGNNVEQQTLSPEQTAVSGTTLDFSADFAGITWGTPAGAVTERIRFRVQFRTTNGTSRTPVWEIGGSTSTTLDFPVLWLGTLIGKALLGLAGKAALLGTAVAVGRGLQLLAGRGVLAGSGVARGRALASLAGRGRLSGEVAARGRALMSLAGRGLPTGVGVAQGRSLLGLTGRDVAGALGQLRGRSLLNELGRAPVAGAGELAGRGLAGLGGSGQPSALAPIYGRALVSLAGRGLLEALQAAVGGCIETIIAAVRSRYVLTVETAHAVATLHDNEIEAMPIGEAFVRFSIELDRSFQMDFGGPTQSRRLIGNASAEIYLPFGVGDQEAWELADIINDAFRGQAADGVVYSPAPFPITRGRVGDRWVLEVVVPFYAECAEAVSS